ncbi:MAG: hypothetical protein F6J97_02975 [Leptolyngbya sp. SIO4C1]|nr:hypothetical protein [Leptolyngbya sp. SIO4C1]
MTEELGKAKDTAITPVSHETRAIIEREMADEPDEIKQKLGELIDAIKQRTSAEMQAAGDVTRENYATTMAQLQQRLKKTETFFKEQERSIDRSVQEMTDEATDRWETFVDDLQRVGNRLDNAVNAAWKALTEPDESA